MARFGTANIKNFPDMPISKVKADARKIGKECTIWGGQEISPEDTDPVLAALETLTSKWNKVHGRYETPIFYRADLWEMFNPHAYPLDRGNLELTAKNSAITGASFASKKVPGLVFAFINCHLITTPVGAPERERQFAIEYLELRRMVRFYHALGLTVFVCGDFNNSGLPFPAPKNARRAKWLTDNTGKRIDKIGAWTHVEGVRIVDGTVGITALNSDHDLISINVDLES